MSTARPPRGTKLDVAFPDIAAQWHPTKNGDLSASDVSFGADRFAWWQCEKGHEWHTRVNFRTGQNRGCPICAGRKVAKGSNDLASKFPELAVQWHPTKNGDLTPSDVTPGTDRKVWWLCQNGHEWETRVSNRSNGSGCRGCRGGA